MGQFILQYLWVESSVSVKVIYFTFLVVKRVQSSKNEFFALQLHV